MRLGFLGSERDLKTSHIILLRPIGLCSLIHMKATALECTLCVRLGSLDGGAVWIEHTAAVFPSQTPALDHSCSVVPLTAIYLSLCAEKPIGPHASQKSCIQTLFAACRLFCFSNHIQSMHSLLIGKNVAQERQTPTSCT